MKLFCDAFQIHPYKDKISKPLKSKKLCYVKENVQTEVCSEIRYIHIPMNGISIFQNLGIWSIKYHYAVSSRE